MLEVIENYGIGLLEMLGVLGIFAILLDCAESGGVLSNIVSNYMNSICG